MSCQRTGVTTLAVFLTLLFALPAAGQKLRSFQKRKIVAIKKCVSKREGSVLAFYSNGRRKLFKEDGEKKYLCVRDKWGRYSVKFVEKKKILKERRVVRRREPRQEPVQAAREDTPPPAPAYPRCSSPERLQGAEETPPDYCPRGELCAEGVCGDPASCVSTETGVSVALADGKRQDHLNPGGVARYFCRRNRETGRIYVDYAAPCSSLHHRWDGFANRQCSTTSVGAFCAEGLCGDLAACEQIDNQNIRITLINGASEVFTSGNGYRCLNTPDGLDAQNTLPCEGPFHKYGYYCRSGSFCADGICRPLANCQQVSQDNIVVTLDSGESQSYSGNYRCVSSGGVQEVRTAGVCAHPYGQQERFCGQRFVDGQYAEQFCADGICSLLGACQQVDEDTVTVTLDTGSTQTFDGYTCRFNEEGRVSDIISTAPTTFSCSSPSAQQEINRDGRIVARNYCSNHRGEACIQNHCQPFVTCDANNENVTVTSASGESATYSHGSGSARYFCRRHPETGQLSLDYTAPCSSLHHTWDGFANRQCSTTSVGAFCAEGFCGDLAACEQIDNQNIRITLINGASEVFTSGNGYRCLNTPDGLDAQNTLPCEDPFHKYGYYCRSGSFCADGICRPLASCQQVSQDNIVVTLDSGESQTYSGNYTCGQDDAGHPRVVRR